MNRQAILIVTCLVLPLIGGCSSQPPAPKRASSEVSAAIAYPLKVAGGGPYAKRLDGSAGVVFEETDGIGYFYATDSEQQTIFDALQVYGPKEGTRLLSSDEAFIVWSPSNRRAGLYYADRFQAVFDFDAKRGVCRLGLPSGGKSGWSQSGHEWDDALVQGLEP